MKDALLILPRYLFFAFLLLVVLSLSSLIPFVSTRPWRADFPALIVESILLPCIIGALFFSFPFVPKEHGPRLVAVLILCVLSGASLFFGLIMTDEVNVNRPPSDIDFPFEARSIQKIDSGLVVTDSVVPDQRKIEGLVRLTYRSTDLFGLDVGASSPIDAAFYPTALYDPGTDLLNAKAERIPISPADPTVSPLLSAPPFLKALLGEIDEIQTYLLSLRSVSLDRYLTACIGICVFAASCLVFLTLSSWRFINFLITVLMFRGVFLVFALLTGRLIGEVFSGIEHNFIAQHLPALLLLVLAVLFVALDHLVVRRVR